jgi:hypothetical protein
MADPISGAAVGGFASAVGSKVIERIVEGENDYEAWVEEVTDAASEAEAARRFCLDSSYTEDRAELERLMETVGKQAQKLEVIGEGQEYPKSEVETVRKMAQVCTRYSSISKGSGLKPEEELSEKLPPLVEDIFDFA